MMNNFKVKDYAHYSVGSDIYPVQIIEVSPNGKTVKAVGIRWRLKPTDNEYAFAERQLENDVEIIGTNDRVLTFKSRKGQPHKEPGKCGAELKDGFVAYRDPSF